MTEKTLKTVVNPNLEVFVAELMELAINGWELDMNQPPAQYGLLYEAHVLQDTDKIVPPAMTRAEITAKARAAKAAKAKAEDAPADAQAEAAPEAQTAAEGPEQA